MGGSPILRPYPAKNCDFTFLVKTSDVVCLAKVVCIPPCEMAVITPDDTDSKISAPKFPYYCQYNFTVTSCVVKNSLKWYFCFSLIRGAMLEAMWCDGENKRGNKEVNLPLLPAHCLPAPGQGNQLLSLENISNR